MLSTIFSGCSRCEINGGSNYDSLKVAKCLVISLVTYSHEWINYSVPSVPIYYRRETTAKGTGLGVMAGKEDPVELDSSLTL